MRRTCVVLLGAWLAACATDDIVDLGDLGGGKADTALPRVIEIDLAPGDSRWFRISTEGFVASLDQDDREVAAQLVAKHFEQVFSTEPSIAPHLVVAGDGTKRNWTLTVSNHGDADLEATLVVDLPRASGELGIVSDIDETVLPPETAAGLPPPYPGVSTLYTKLEAAVAGDLHYVTARGPDAVVELPAWMARFGLPAGSIDTGVSGIPSVARREKVADISRILDATGDQRFVLFGDTAHVDPDVYTDIRAKYPARIAAVFIHQVTATIDPGRVAGMHVVDDYAQAAAAAFGDGLITEAEARAIIDAARAEGLAITDAEIEALLDGARPN